MYYISTFDSQLQLSAVKKRLADFKGIEGAKYHVRTTRQTDGLRTLPVYQFTEGRLVKTREWSVFNLWNL